MARNRRQRTRSGGTGWRLGILVGAGLLALAAMARAADAPTSEQLLAATIHAADATVAKLAPGGWWNDVPEFNGRLDGSAPADQRDQVINHVFGRPDNDPSELATTLDLYPTPEASAAAFTATAASDQRDYGPLAEGPKVGDQSRYLRQPTDNSHSGGASLRFQFRRYLARIDANGKGSAITMAALAALGRVVIGRLAALDAGKLAAPGLPGWAKTLPSPNQEFPAVMGTATVARDSTAWILSSQSGMLAVSPRLRTLLHRGGDGTAVMRRYALAASAANVVELTLVPFTNTAGADAFLAQLKHEDPRRGDVEPAGDGVAIAQPIPDITNAFRADFRLGRDAVSVVCYAPFAATTRACEAAVRDVATRIKQHPPSR